MTRYSALGDASYSCSTDGGTTVYEFTGTFTAVIAGGGHQTMDVTASLANGTKLMVTESQPSLCAGAYIQAVVVE